MKNVLVFLIFCFLAELILGQDTEFAIQEKLKQIVITIDQWTTIDFKQADDGFYFMLRSDSPVDYKFKYIRIKLL